MEMQLVFPSLCNLLDIPNHIPSNAAQICEYCRKFMRKSFKYPERDRRNAEELPILSADCTPMPPEGRAWGCAQNQVLEPPSFSPVRYSRISLRSPSANLRTRSRIPSAFMASPGSWAVWKKQKSGGRITPRLRHMAPSNCCATKSPPE